MSNFRLFAWGFLIAKAFTALFDLLIGVRNPEWGTPDVCVVVGLFVIALFGDREKALTRDRDGAEGGDANAAPVPKDRQARAEGIAQPSEPRS